MGLDGIELVMEIESEFGISIPDAGSLRTVGDLVALCLDRIRAAKSLPCPSLTSFLSLRRVVREIRNDPRLRIRPKDEIATCLDGSDRQNLWRRLPELLNAAPRRLQRPPWLRRTLLLVVLAIPIVLLTILPWSAGLLVSVCVSTIVLGIALIWLTSSFRTHPHNGFRTFGEITKRMVRLTIATNPPRETDYESVFLIVKRIVVETLGVDAEDVVPSARFVEDLGVG